MNVRYIGQNSKPSARYARDEKYFYVYYRDCDYGGWGLVVYAQGE